METNLTGRALVAAGTRTRFVVRATVLARLLARRATARTGRLAPLHKQISNFELTQVFPQCEFWPIFRVFWEVFRKFCHFTMTKS